MMINWFDFAWLNYDMWIIFGKLLLSLKVLLTKFLEIRLHLSLQPSYWKERLSQLSSFSLIDFAFHSSVFPHTWHSLVKLPQIVVSLFLNLLTLFLVPFCKVFEAKGNLLCSHSETLEYLLSEFTLSLNFLKVCFEGLFLSYDLRLLYQESALSWTMITNFENASRFHRR